MSSNKYALGHSSGAKRRLELQDRQHGLISEELLDCLALRHDDRVVELGVGTGNFGRRIMRRLGPEGVLVGVDFTQHLLEEACQNLAGNSSARFEPIVDDVRTLGPWLNQAGVITGRTVLHHIPMVETFLGALRARVDSGTRIGFLEPEFRLPTARLGWLEQRGHPQIAPLRHWNEGIVRYYQARNLSPDIGAMLPQVFESAGYRAITHRYHGFPLDRDVIENAIMYYEEVSDKYVEMGIMTPDEIEEQTRFFASAQEDPKCSIWGLHFVACKA